MARRKRSIEIDLDGLVERPRDELVAIWKASFATQPPRGSSQAFVARLLAYDLQVEARGGLSPGWKSACSRSLPIKHPSPPPQNSNRRAAYAHLEWGHTSRRCR
ncbi:MAG: DUF2924 domain-containing protein [Oceanicaulis sp.]|nr:DUF2924 domain-containing protein [Oceanicaulis sp.]